MTKTLQIRSNNSLTEIITRLKHLSTNSVFSSTKVTIEQVNDHHYEFWITRKGFGIFSDLYNLFGQLIVEETQKVLIQTQTDLSLGIRAILYLVLSIATIGIIVSLNKPNFVIMILFLFGAGLLLMYWIQLRNRFANEILRELTR